MNTLWQSIKLGINTMCSRRIYLCAMVFVPLLTCLFFLSLLNAGLPTRVPTAVVDLDHSPMSREITRSLAAQQLVSVTEMAESYDKALADVRSGKTFGFYVIPANFQRDALSGRTPTISYYANMTYFVPGTFSYKGYKTVSVSATAGLVSSKASELGLPDRMVTALIQPMAIDINPVNNPWTDYSLYLTPSFSAGVLELMIVIMTIFSITGEIKYGTSLRWMHTAGGSIFVALTGKLLPQTVVWCVVGWCTQSLMYFWCGFPMNCALWIMLLAMFFFVLACQALGVFIASVLPNPRMALSIGALFCILAFSFTGFSFPVQNMYGALRIFSYIMPVRYYFLIHIQEALNGVPLYYARMSFVALLLFLPAGSLLLWRLKRAMLKPVYVP